MKAVLFILAFLALIAMLITGLPHQPAKKFVAKDYLARTNNNRLVPKVEKNYGETIRAICRAEKVDPILMSGSVVEKIIIVESSGKPNARKENDGRGLMGVSPAIADSFGVNPDSLYVPFWNLAAGIRYLNSLLHAKGINGNIDAALVAYNCGLPKYLHNYLAAGVNLDSAQYVLKIKALMACERGSVAKDLNQLVLDQ